MEFNAFFHEFLGTRKRSLTPADNTVLQLLDSDITTGKFSLVLIISYILFTYLFTDSKTAIQLYLLSVLVPPKPRTKLKKLHWKPSVIEARDGMILHVSCAGDIDGAKDNHVSSMYSKGLTVQPYIIIVGSTLSNISQALVVINNCTYPCISVLEALDFCFKAYIVLDAKYPFQSQHIWYLIQWQVYGYYAPTDPKIPFINDLMTKR